MPWLVVLMTVIFPVLLLVLLALDLLAPQPTGTIGLPARRIKSPRS